MASAKNSEEAVTPARARAFIQANTRLERPSLLPELQLHLASEVCDLWQMTEDERDAIGLPPPYWAFAWAGGQALARYLLDNALEVRRRGVLDLGAGSGLVAIAAGLAGAATVTASDIDPYAQAAIGLNAAVNGAEIDAVVGDVIGGDASAWQLILVGDLFYERLTAERLEPWLRGLVAGGTRVLVGDPRRTYLPREGLAELASYQVPTSQELEDTDLRNARVWELAAE